MNAPVTPPAGLGSPDKSDNGGTHCGDATASPSGSSLPLLHRVFQDLPTGWDAPNEDRLAVDLRAGEGASAYGELEPEGLQALLTWLAPGPEDVFYDLGSGTGRVPLQVALTSKVGRALGIELSAHRHAIARRALARILRALDNHHARHLRRRVRFHLQDVRNADLTDATLVYAASLCFSDPLLDAVAARLTTAKTLRAFITIRPLPPTWERRFVFRGDLRVPMTWDPRARVRVYERRDQG
jgi:SAM-dependent methyltransferase